MPDRNAKSDADSNRYGYADSYCNRHSNGHRDSDGCSNGDCHSNRYRSADRHSNRHIHANCYPECHSHSHRNGNRDRHGDCHRRADGDSNRDRYSHGYLSGGDHTLDEPDDHGEQFSLL